MRYAPRPRWSNEDLDLVRDDSLSNGEVAALIGRTPDAVKTLRYRIGRGWEPKTEARPVTSEELDFIRRNTMMTAEQVATHLARSYGIVVKIRRQLGRDEGIDFGTGPYDKSPFYRPADCLLIAKTCVRCGIIRGGADFSSGHAKCRFCRAELRDHLKDAQARIAAEQRVRELAPRFGVPYLSRRYDEYAKADIEVLGRKDLTTCEKAAMTGRSYGAANQAMQDYALAEKRPERREPSGVWRIEFPQGAA